MPAPIAVLSVRPRSFLGSACAVGADVGNAVGTATGLLLAGADAGDCEGAAVGLLDA